MKTIIIPTDYSDNAFNAAKHGFFLAYQLKAQVLLLHVCHVPATQGPKTGETAAQSDPVAPHIEQLEKIGGQLKQSYPVHLEYAVRFGVLLEELTRLVESQHADVVVMGRRGANLLEEKVFGSASMSVLYQAAFPVLIVPGETPVKPIRRILFACDYSTLSLDNSLSLLKAIASLQQAEVQVLHIAQPHDVLMDGSLAIEGAHLEKILRGVKHELTWMEEESVSAGIEQGIVSYGADLLVMIPRKRKLWEQMINPSQTRQVALDIAIPLLALPNPNYENS
jgi:nucleotide-binding universal stress UspA family protein